VSIRPVAPVETDPGSASPRREMYGIWSHARRRRHKVRFGFDRQIRLLQTRGAHELVRKKNSFILMFYKALAAISPKFPWRNRIGL
jgi:hypothetical protein